MSALVAGPAGDGDVRGFTLVELLVAIMLFALLSAAATALLSFGVDARSRTAERLDALASVTRTRALLIADLGQAAPRLWRDENGAVQPAFTGEPNVLRLVRRGWRNDGGAPRASLQRVEYRLNGDRLERLSWPLVDGSAPNPPALTVGGITALRLRFHSDGRWLDRWAPEAQDGLPDAVEVTLASRAIPELRQVFLVGPGAVR